MASHTAQDIQDQTGTDLATAIIERFITRSDAKIASKCAAKGLSAPADADAIDIGILLTSAQVIRRHMTDGTLPEKYTAGDVSETSAAGKVVKMYEDEAQKLLNAYFEESREDIDFSVFRVVGVDGERVGSYEAMETSEEDET